MKVTEVIIIMNDNIKDKIKHSGKSLYRISKETGIPYTTLNELMNEKKNINHIKAETVYRLSVFFKCDTKDLLNTFSLLNNSEGNYMDVPYKWISSDSKSTLHIYYDNEDIILTKANTLAAEINYATYRELTEILIENYIRKNELRRQLI